MKKDNIDHIAVIDIGTSKIVCLVAQLNYNEDIKILGIGHQIAKGIGADGVIADIKSLENSIVAAVSKAEKQSQTNIENIYVNFSGNKLRSQFETITIDITGGEVRDKDVLRINELAFEKFSNDTQEVIQAIPMSYSIDGISGINNPRFMYGSKLEVHLNLVTLSKSALHNLLNCLARCHLNISGIIPSAYASALSCLSAEEMQNGVTLLDIGEGNSSIAIFLDGKMHYTISFPFGGALLTRDIQQIFSLKKSDAQRVKSLYGSVFYEEINSRDTIDLFDMINTADENSANYIQKHKLCEIIYDRSKEMLGYINRFLNNNNSVNAVYKKAFGNIIITGGMANLLGISELTKQIFGARVRIAKPKLFNNMPKEHHDVKFATAYGLVCHAKDDLKKDIIEFKNFNKKHALWHKIKDITLYNKSHDFLRKYF